MPVSSHLGPSDDLDRGCCTSPYPDSLCLGLVAISIIDPMTYLDDIRHILYNLNQRGSDIMAANLYP